MHLWSPKHSVFFFVLSLSSALNLSYRTGNIRTLSINSLSKIQQQQQQSDFDFVCFIDHISSGSGPNLSFSSNDSPYLKKTFLAI